MTYKITAKDVKSVTDVEEQFGIDRLLPNMNQIPEKFLLRGENQPIEVTIAECMFYGREIPPGHTVTLIDGVTPKEACRCVNAHIRSFSPKHEHKISGSAYMISLIAHIDAKK